MENIRGERDSRRFVCQREVDLESKNRRRVWA